MDDTLINISSDTAIIIMKWLNCILLFYLITRFGKKPFFSLLDGVSDECQSRIDEAKMKKENAAKLLKSNQEKLDKVDEVIRGIMENAKEEAKSSEEAIIKETLREIELIKEHHKSEIANLKVEMAYSLRKGLATEAADIAKQIVLDNINSEDHKKINEEFILNLEKRL